MARLAVHLLCFLAVVYVVTFADDLRDFSAGRPAYDVRSVVVPVLSGAPLRAFVWAMETWPLSALLLAKVKYSSEFALPRHLSDTALAGKQPTFYPLVAPTHAQQISAMRAAGAAEEGALEAFAPAAGRPPADLASPVDGDGAAAPFRFWSAEEMAYAYRSGAARPTDVARAVLQAVRHAERERAVPLRAFVEVDEADVMTQAAESDARHAAGRALSVLDGVPVTVKDSFDVRGYVTAGGSTFLRGRKPAERDAALVARVRELGAVIVGKATMTEFGTSPLGDNAGYGHGRNPYNTAHLSGGSSSGSAIAVGAGIVPISIGADGGGSIRIPAAYCGVYGLKGTYGRFSGAGALPVAATVSHTGPLAATARDLAAAYLAMAGATAGDAKSGLQPAPHADGFDRTADLSDLRVGVFREWVERGAQPAQRRAFAATVAALEARGATVVDVRVPHLQAMMTAHKISITSEFTSALERFAVRDGHLSEMTATTRVIFALVRTLRPTDYVGAARVRTFALEFLDALFGQVDVLLTPATGGGAPPVPVGDRVEFSNMTMIEESMRYVSLPNLSGSPAVVFPVGYEDGTGVPLAVQAVARHWDEHVLLRLAHAGEQILRGEGGGRRQPDAWYSVLDPDAVRDKMMASRAGRADM